MIIMRNKPDLLSSLRSCVKLLSGVDRAAGEVRRVLLAMDLNLRARLKVKKVIMIAILSKRLLWPKIPYVNMKKYTDRLEFALLVK